MEANDDTKLWKWARRIKTVWADLYIGGYPRKQNGSGQEGLIFGMKVCATDQRSQPPIRQFRKDAERRGTVFDGKSRSG